MLLLGTALAALGTALLVATVLTARRFGSALPEVDEYLDRWSTLHAGADARRGRLTRGWLRLIYRLARPLARRGVAPDLLTLWGAWVAGLVLSPAAAGHHWPLLGALSLAASGVLDNLDGAVANLTGQATPFGYLLDSLMDRVADGCYLGALYLVGAPGWLVATAAGTVVLLEYTRARAFGAGFHEVGVVTPGERPTRVILGVLALTAAGAFPTVAIDAATASAAAQAVIVGGSWAQLLWVVRRGLADLPASD
ncbi:MAG: CDP-alcohol phosphatidyltransferase family protein [Mycobacteriales bacterium]